MEMWLYRRVCVEYSTWISAQTYSDIGRQNDVCIDPMTQEGARPVRGAAIYVDSHS